MSAACCAYRWALGRVRCGLQCGRAGSQIRWRCGKSGSCVMEARTASRYHEVYARSMRDPEGFWGEAAQAIDWYEPARESLRPGGRRLRPLVCRGESATPATTRSIATSGRGRAAQAAIIYDSPVTGNEAAHHLRGVAGRGRASRRRACGTSASPRATASSSTCRWCPRRWSRCLPARASARSIRWCSAALRRTSSRRASTTAKPKLILSASCGIEPARVVAYKPLLDEAIDLAVAQTGGLPHPAAPASRRDADRRPRPRLDRRCRDAATREANVRACVPVLRPTRSTFSTPPARPASRRAWCATMAATWSR